MKLELVDGFPDSNTDHCAVDYEDHEHQWEPVWSINAAGRAYRCSICWDRTD